MAKMAASNRSLQSRQMHRHSRCWIVTGLCGLRKILGARSEVAFERVSRAMLERKGGVPITFTAHLRVEQPHHGALFISWHSSRPSSQWCIVDAIPMQCCSM